VELIDDFHRESRVIDGLDAGLRARALDSLQNLVKRNDFARTVAFNNVHFIRSAGHSVYGDGEKCDYQDRILLGRFSPMTLPPT